MRHLKSRIAHKETSAIETVNKLKKRLTVGEYLTLYWTNSPSNIAGAMKPKETCLIIGADSQGLQLRPPDRSGLRLFTWPKPNKYERVDDTTFRVNNMVVKEVYKIGEKV